MSGEHLIIVDDDPDVREALVLMLEPQGYRVSAHATGPEGLTAIQRERPDLVLLDVMLAHPAEGFRLAHELKADPATGGIPIVMISSIGHTLGLDYAHEMGNDYVATEAFLDKPIRPETLLRTIRRILEPDEPDV